MGERDNGAMTPETALLVLGAPERNSIRMRAEAAQVVAQLVEAALPTTYLDAADANGNPKCWHFFGYRPGAAGLGKHSPSTLNDADRPQYQGVIFADGSVAMRWLTAKRSTSVWDSFGDMFEVHGYPEYGTEIHWPNGAPQEAREAIEAAAQAYRERKAAEEPAAIVTGPGAELETEGRAVSSLAELTEEETAELLDIQEQKRTGRTVAVCLDCADPQPLIVPFGSAEAAQDWAASHRESGHQFVTVLPGWPDRSAAASRARRDVAGTVEELK